MRFPIRTIRYPAMIAWILSLVLAACTPVKPNATEVARPTVTAQPSLPNPASVYCEQQGNKLEICTAADGSQSGVCVFPDGSECDEWAFYRGECHPASQSGAGPASTAIPTPLPIDPADYQGWWTYTHAVYDFSIKLPEDWVVEEVTASDPLMNRHTLTLRPRTPLDVDTDIRMTFRRTGEDVPLWPTGVGAGSFVPLGMLDVAGQPVRRVLFVCPGGQVNDIWYQGAAEEDANIHLGDLEFGFIFGYTGVYCQEGYSLGGKVQRVGEMIIASLEVP